MSVRLSGIMTGSVQHLECCRDQSEGHELNQNDIDAVSDRPVSFEEYERAVLRYRERMAANGTPLGDFRYDEPTRLYDWTVREDYFDNPGAQACDNEFASIDRQWQSQVEHLQDA